MLHSGAIRGMASRRYDGGMLATIRNVMIAALTALTAPVVLTANAQAQWSTESVLMEMAPLIQPCVQPTGGPRVFTRCFDTHSAVHAHWAAYRIARFLPAFNQLALDSELALQTDKIRLEVANHVDYPYAEAWFLLLAMEYERWATEQSRPEPLRLRVFGDAIAARLLDQYEQTAPNPRTPEYSNASWHVLQLHRWYEETGDTARRARVDTLVHQNFLGPITSPTLRHNIVQPNQFFSIHGNWAHLVLETQDAAIVRQFVQDQGSYPIGHILPNPITGFAHSYGMGWSRAWALRSMARNALNPIDRFNYWRAANAHIQVGMERHMMLSGQFAAYSHWVPQFAVYAVTDGA